MIFLNLSLDVGIMTTHPKNNVMSVFRHGVLVTCCVLCARL